jgi:hypothetical protein
MKYIRVKKPLGVASPSEPLTSSTRRGRLTLSTHVPAGRFLIASDMPCLRRCLAALRQNPHCHFELICFSRLANKGLRLLRLAISSLIYAIISSCQLALPLSLFQPPHRAALILIIKPCSEKFTAKRQSFKCLGISLPPPVRPAARQLTEYALGRSIIYNQSLVK